MPCFRNSNIVQWVGHIVQPSHHSGKNESSALTQQTKFFQNDKGELFFHKYYLEIFSSALFWNSHLFLLLEVMKILNIGGNSNILQN